VQSVLVSRTGFVYDEQSKDDHVCGLALAAGRRVLRRTRGDLYADGSCKM
jgi:hypothetical protein